jgi:hypothetical protein
MESYFESSWAILSSICLINVLFGLLVINLTSVSPASLVPVVTSCAGAIANGCCYYAYYTDYPVINRATASIISDLMWMVRPASCYSHLRPIRACFDLTESS